MIHSPANLDILQPQIYLTSKKKQEIFYIKFKV